MTIERFIDFDRFLILALIGFVIIEAPVFIALIRGIRGHKLNLIIMLIGLGAIMLLLFSFSLIPLALCWLVALVMSFVYKRMIRLLTNEIIAYTITVYALNGVG